MDIEEAASDILADVMSQSSQLSLVALAIKTQQHPGEPPHLQIIQLRTKDKIVVFDVRNYYYYLFLMFV
jgi:hypothetical protein